MRDERAVIEWAKKIIALDNEIHDCNRALDDAKYEAWKWDWVQFREKQADFAMVQKVLQIDDIRMSAMLFHLLKSQLDAHKQSLLYKMVELINHDLNTAQTERE